MNNGPEPTPIPTERTDAMLPEADRNAIPTPAQEETPEAMQDATPDAAQDAALESALRDALRHTDPPADFTSRLIARVVAGDHPRAVPDLQASLGAISEAPRDDLQPPAPRPRQPSGKVLHWPPSRLIAGGAIAAALVLGILEGELALKHFREQQRRINEATAQFQTTERVTVRALAQAREQLQKAGVPLALD